MAKNKYKFTKIGPELILDSNLIKCYQNLKYFTHKNVKLNWKKKKDKKSYNTLKSTSSSFIKQIL